MGMVTQITEACKQAIAGLYSHEVADNQVQIQKTKKEFEGDLTLVVFPLLRITKKSPEASAEEIGEYLVQNSELVANYNVVKGFLNLSIADSIWLSAFNQWISNENYGYAGSSSGKTFMVEYSSPNTNKPLHLGHLRNNFLGYSVSEILKANGHEVYKTQIINDRGIHICKSMLAWQRFGNGETPESSGLKGDHLVGKYYVRFDVELKAQSEPIFKELMQNGAPDNEEVNKAITILNSGETLDEDKKKGLEGKVMDLAKAKTEILQAAQDMLRKWEAKEPEIYSLWETMNGWVYEGFDVTYKEMGVDFDKLYYESDTYILGKNVVEEGLAKGDFYQKEDGSVWCDLSSHKMDDKLLLRGDGTSVYMTQDVGTAIERYKDYPNLSGLTYTVGNEQNHHFKVLFTILKKLGYSWADGCYHLSYGMVELPKGMGRMKSREGTVVDADDLMNNMVEDAKEMTQERGHIEGMTDEEKYQLYKTIGHGGLKYYLLKVDPKKKLVFNPHESIDLNGNTGPFIQYAFARIQSIVRKSEGFDKAVDLGISMNDYERTLITELSDYPAVIKEAGEQYSPALIANYAYNLAKSYNSFFQAVPILKAESQSELNFRVALSYQVGEVLKSSMKLLGINVPERM